MHSIGPWAVVPGNLTGDQDGTPVARRMKASNAVGQDVVQEDDGPGAVPGGVAGLRASCGDGLGDGVGDDCGRGRPAGGGLAT